MLHSQWRLSHSNACNVMLSLESYCELGFTLNAKWWQHQTTHTHTQIQTNSTQTTKRTVHKRPTNFYNTGVRYNLAFVAPNFDRASMTTLRFVATSNKRTATSGATAQQRDRGTHQCWTASQASRMAARIGVLGTSIYSWRWRNMLHWTLLGDVYLYNPIHEYMYNIYVNSAIT